MPDKKSSSSNFQLVIDELVGQVNQLVDLNDRTSGLVSSAQQLAQRNPMLGTAPPALHLAMRLREAAGPAGLTGEVSAANTELTNYHQALHDTVTRYQQGDDQVAWQLNGQDQQ